MDYKVGDSVIACFTTQNFSTGIATDADAIPSGTVSHNGTDDTGVTVTSTNLGTGKYKATFTIPTSGYSAGDSLSLFIAASVGGVLGKDVVWSSKIGYGSVWDQSASSVSLINSIGKYIKDLLSSNSAQASSIISSLAANLDVPVSTRMASGAYVAPDNATIANIWGRVSANLDAQVSAIKTKTDQLITLPIGTVTGTPTTTSFAAVGSFLPIDNAYKNGYVLFTSGSLNDATPMLVDSYIASGQIFNFAPPGLLVAPSPGDQFIVFGAVTG